MVNGKRFGAVIFVACPGPVGGTSTGPPIGNQWVGVHRVAFGFGNTVPDPHLVFATLGASRSPFAAFWLYDLPQAIPPTLQVPCEGSGVVTFSSCWGTMPCAADSGPDVVPVTFVNIAV